MPVTVTVDPNFIYAMLKEYNDAVKAKNVGGVTLSDAYLAVLYGGSEILKFSFNCGVSAVTGGANIDCWSYDSYTRTYTVDGAAYRFKRTIGTTTYTYELYRVSSPEVTKNSGDVLFIYATAVLTVG